MPGAAHDGAAHPPSSAHDGGAPRGARPAAGSARAADFRGFPAFIRRLVLTIGPARNDHQAAIRCAVGVFVPLMTLLAVGRLDLAIFASFGAFTGIYGRNEPHRVRLVSQLRAGGLMLGVIAAATVAARLAPGGALGPWGIVVLTTIVAWACGLAVGFWQLRPAGSLFHIFAFAAVASLPHQPPLAEALLAAAAAVVLCLAIGVSSRVAPSRRTPLTFAGVRGAWAVRADAEARRGLWLESCGYLVAAGIAGVLATLLGQALGVGHSYWAMVAAVVPLVGHSRRDRVDRGLQRILGTVVGLGVLAAIVALRPEPWLFIVLIAVCQFGAEMLIARQYFLAQVVVTPLALMSTLLVARAEPGALLRDRLIDTAVGAAVGVAVVLAPAVWRRWRGSRA